MRKAFVSILVFGILVLSPFVEPSVYRASGAVQEAIIIPIAPVYQTEWDSFGCIDSTEWSCIDDFGDGNTTYLSSISTTLQISITDALDVVLVGGFSNVTASLTLHVIARANSTWDSAGETSSVFIAIQGESYDCGGIIFANVVSQERHRILNVSYSEFTIVLPFPGYAVAGSDDCENANPDWTLSLVNRIRFQMTHVKVPNGPVRSLAITSVWAVLSWSTSLTYLADWGGSLCWLLIIVGAIVVMSVGIAYKKGWVRR